MLCAALASRGATSNPFLKAFAGLAADAATRILSIVCRLVPLTAGAAAARLASHSKSQQCSLPHLLRMTGAGQGCLGSHPHPDEVIIGHYRLPAALCAANAA